MNPRYYGGLGAKVLNPGDTMDTTGAANASRALAEGYGYWNEAPMLQEAAFWGNPLSATEQTLQGMQRRDIDYQRMYEETLRENLRNALQARQMGQNRDLKQQELAQNAWAKQGDWGIASDKINREAEASKNRLQSDLTKWMFGEQKADKRVQMQTDATKYGADKRAESSWIQNLMNSQKADESNALRREQTMAHLFGQIRPPQDSDIQKFQFAQSYKKTNPAATEAEVQIAYANHRQNIETAFRQNVMRGIYGGEGSSPQLPQAGQGQAGNQPANPGTQPTPPAGKPMAEMTPQELRDQWWWLSMRDPLKPFRGLWNMMGQDRSPRANTIELQ